MMLSKFDVIFIVHQCRLLFSTEKDFCKAVGASWETVKENANQSQAVDTYYLRLARKCMDVTEMSLYDITESYVRASELYRSLDWGDRHDIRTRRKFLRMLFRMFATAGKKMTQEEEDKFLRKDADLRLQNVLFPEGWLVEIPTDFLFILLFAFGVVAPYSPATEGKAGSRAMRTPNTREALKKMLELLTLIRDDIPRLGARTKPVALDQQIADLRMLAENPEAEYTPIQFLYALQFITGGYLSMVRPSLSNKLQGMLIDLPMRGIWIDDADGGRTRFWIFPENMIAAFCYRKIGAAWELFPYEFTCTPDLETNEAAFAYFITPKGNTNLFQATDGSLDDEMTSFILETETHPDTGELSRVDFTDMGVEIPKEIDWRSMRRLNRDEGMYKKFRDILSQVYFEEESDFYKKYKNHAPLLTDQVNNLVARDGEYIYLSYYRRPDRWAVREVGEETGVFSYDFYYKDGLPDLTLLGLEISEEHPLFAIPTEKRQPMVIPFNLQQLDGILRINDFIKTVHLYETNGRKIIFFRDFGKCFDVNGKEMQEIGIKKFTSREQFFKGI